MCTICDNQYIFSTKQRIQLSKELNIDTLVQEAINQLYNDRQIDKPTQQALLQSHYEPLKQAVNEGFGKIEYNSPNYEFLKQLQTNTAVFAAFKNHAYIKEMVGLLKDQEGNLRSRESFKAEALKIDSTYRTTYLDAEYDTAVRTARLATQWQKIQKNKKLYPNLRYLLTKSSQPDEKHLKYVGIVAPVDSVFWQTHYPPNRWRCQCGVEQTDDEATDIPSNLPPVDKGFDFNAGADKMIFTVESSKYYKQANALDKKTLAVAANRIVAKEFSKDAPFKKIYESKNGGFVEMHDESYKDNKVDSLKKNAILLANNGEQVKILPPINDPDLRKKLIPESIVNNSKTPDFWLIKQELSLELKEVEGKSKNSIKRPFSTAKGQSANLIIEIPEAYPFDLKEVKTMIKNKLNQPESIIYKDAEIWLNFKGLLIYNPHKKQ